MRREHFAIQLWWATAQLHNLYSIVSALWFVISPIQVVYGTWDGVATKVPRENDVDLKSMQVNMLKSLARMTKMGGEKRSDQ